MLEQRCVHVIHLLCSTNRLFPLWFLFCSQQSHLILSMKSVEMSTFETALSVPALSNDFAPGAQVPFYHNFLSKLSSHFAQTEFVRTSYGNLAVTRLIGAARNKLPLVCYSDLAVNRTFETDISTSSDFFRSYVFCRICRASAFSRNVGWTWLLFYWSPRPWGWCYDNCTSLFAT